MNKNTKRECVLSHEKQLQPSKNELMSGNHFIAGSVDSNCRQLIWSSRKPDDWEILVYKQSNSWEACFFRWPVHHEHAFGPSFDSVRQRAEQRIRVLEARRLKTTEWRQTVS